MILVREMLCVTWVLQICWHLFFFAQSMVCFHKIYICILKKYVCCCISVNFLQMPIWSRCSIVLLKSSIFLFIFCIMIPLMNPLIIVRWLLKYLTIIVNLFFLAVVSVFALCILKLCCCVYTVSTVKYSWRI